MGEKWKKIAVIFLVMAKIGCFTFGGGWSIIAQMQVEFVEKRRLITQEQLVDFMSLSRSFPGIMIINIAVMFGYTLCGFWGAVAAAFGLSLPAIAAIGFVTFFYSSLRSNVYVERILNGVRSAVIPIILSAALKLKKTALVSKAGWLLAAAGLYVCAFTEISKIFVVIAGAFLGLVIWKGGKGHVDAVS